MAFHVAKCDAKRIVALMTGMSNKPSVLKFTVSLAFVTLIAFLCSKCLRRSKCLHRGDAGLVTERNVGKTFVRNSSSLAQVRNWKPTTGVRIGCEKSLYASGSRMPLPEADKKSQIAGEAVSYYVRTMLSLQLNEKSEAECARAASDKNQLMDALLNQPDIPTDYGETMISLCRDKSQDLLTRDFAVQHIGLYAQTLSRRGVYNPKSDEAKSLRDALFDAACETRTVVAAAAFRALSDMSAFDAQINARRLDSMLAACAGGHSAAPAARAMAVQLCGERRVNSARPALERILASPDSPEILRRSASRVLALLQ